MKLFFLLLSYTVITCFAATAQGQIITTYAGNGTAGSPVNGGIATAGSVNHPLAIAVDNSGGVYFNSLNGEIYKVNSAGINAKVANAASVGTPSGLAVDRAGNVYVTDEHFMSIRKISPSGTITTIGGNYTPGYSGDNGPATNAEIHSPCGIAIDNSGNIYFADKDNARIRKIDGAGIISTVGGNGEHGHSGDGGPATDARIDHPNAIAVDAIGNIYVSDGAYYYLSDSARIRKISPAGIITNFAGKTWPFTYGCGGDGGSATDALMSNVGGIAVDTIGNVFIADIDCQRIRKINTAGIINTIAGNGHRTDGGCCGYTGGFTGDGGAATAAELNNPIGICLDQNGNMYIADMLNNRIRKVSKAAYAVEDVDLADEFIRVFPNTSYGHFTVNLTGISGASTITVADVIGRIVETRATRAAGQEIEEEFTVGAVPGIYMLRVDTEIGAYRKEIIINR